MKLQTKVIACALLVISSGFVLANDAGDFRRDISESQQLQTREQPDKNPMLAVLPNMHPLSKSFALRQADLDGDEIPELLRLDIGKQRVLIEDKQGTWLGEVKSDGIIAGYSMVDVDGDGRLEILVMQQNEKRLLAYDYYGNSLVELEKRLQQLSRLYDELALARSIKFLHEQRVVHNDQGLTGPSDEDMGACDETGKIAITWEDSGMELDPISGRRLIEGTSQNDVIVGTNSHDTIIGYGGNDIICAGSGDDWIYGDSHEFDSVGDNGDSDHLFGGSGDDFLFGGSGSDFMFAGDGSDTLYGGDSNDYLGGDGGYPQPVQKSYSGNDFLVGMWGNDFVVGGLGDDVVNATAFDDVDTESGFSMGFPEGNDTCYVHLNETMSATISGCESVVISDW